MGTNISIFVDNLKKNIGSVTGKDLSNCSYDELVDESIKYFNSVLKEHQISASKLGCFISPTVKSYVVSVIYDKIDLLDSGTMSREQYEFFKSNVYCLKRFIEFFLEVEDVKCPEVDSKLLSVVNDILNGTIDIDTVGYPISSIYMASLIYAKKHWDAQSKEYREFKLKNLKRIQTFFMHAFDSLPLLELHDSEALAEFKKRVRVNLYMLEHM